ncbi:MAG: MarR family transcriptional regulator [Proteobacteria bacterium]|nr:MarR family transcriptional regulator [Pseudomonadota bacterium]
MTEGRKDRAARAVAQWQAEFPDWNIRPMEMLGRLRESAAVITRDHMVPVFAQFGLQDGEFDVLAALRRSGAPYELTPTNLFEITMMSSGGMTARLDRLERMGLVARRPNPADRRGTLVRLTEAGIELIERALPAHMANQMKLTDCLTDSELGTLSTLLNKLLSHATTEPDAGDA